MLRIRFDTRYWALAAAGLAVAGLMAGCSASPSSSDDPTSAPVAAVSADDLVGAWVTGENYDAPDVPFLRFTVDGTWTGSDGCNGVEGDWQLAADGVLTVTAGPSTLIACDGEALPALLVEAHAAQFGGGSLVLVDESGAPLVTLEEAVEGATPDSDTGDDDGTSAVGTWSAAPPAGADVFLSLAADGTVSGRDGCNNLVGSWTEADGVVTFGALASTRMLCEGVDTWLSGANTFSIDGTTATVTDASGAQIGTLQRQG